MKRFLCMLVLVSIFSAFVNSAAAAPAPIKVKVNGRIVEFKETTPYKTMYGVMVPLSEAAKAGGASVEYVKNTNEAKVVSGKTALLFQSDRKSALINGTSCAMLQAAVGKKGRIFVPVKFLYEKLGGKVGWDAKTNTVIVTIKIQAVSTATAKPASSINVLMPASKDFKPYIAELTPVDPQVLKELQAYKDNKDGKLSRVLLDGTALNYYMSNAEVIKAVGEKEVKDCCIAAKSLMEVENNVDYRTIGNDFIQKYRYFFTPLNSLGEVTTDIDLIVHRYEDIKKYKIIEKAEFLTDTSLNYGDKNGENRVRGRLRFMFESIDPQYFKDHGLPAYELNKWYSSDMELRVEIIFSKYANLWHHSYYTYEDRVYLTSTKLSYDK